MAAGAQPGGGRPRLRGDQRSAPAGHCRAPTHGSCGPGRLPGHRTRQAGHLRRRAGCTGPFSSRGPSARLEPDGMSEPAVLVERDGPVLTLTLNRPDKRNAFNAEVLVRLCEAWDLLDGDPELRVGILTGAGGNFSAGADLDRLVGALTSGKPAEDEYEERIRQDFTLIYKGFLKDHYVKKPIVAAVEGYCYAGGMEILQAFDLRVAGEGAQLAISEVQRGLFPMSASTIRLPRQIPYTVAMDMLLVGDPITGERAYEVGLASHLTRDSEAMATALDV